MTKTKTKTSPKIFSFNRVDENPSVYSSVKPISLGDRLRDPLGLPKGSIRAIITLSVLGAYFIALFMGMIMDKAIPESLSTIVVTVVAFYFGTRVASTAGPQEETIIEGNVEGSVDNIDLKDNSQISKR